MNLINKKFVDLEAGIMITVSVYYAKTLFLVLAISVFFTAQSDLKMRLMIFACLVLTNLMLIIKLDVFVPKLIRQLGI